MSAVASVLPTRGVAASFAGAPLDPTAPDARDQLLEELSNPEYTASQPTWFDLLSQAVLDWFLSLQVPAGEGPPLAAILVVLGLIAVAVIIAIVLYGVPRRGRRSRASTTLFGEADRRSARELRRDADAAARREDWSAAIADRYRAIARAMDERTIVPLLPGTTAHRFSASTARLFPDHGDALEAAASRFDAVRYLGETGSPEDYATVVAVDDALAAAPSPVLERRASPVGAPS